MGRSVPLSLKTTLNIQELHTVVRNTLPIRMAIINNNCHGMVRQFQQSYFEERYPSTYWGYSAPDFAQVARAYGVEAATVTEPEGVPDALEQVSETNRYMRGLIAWLGFRQTGITYERRPRYAGKSNAPFWSIFFFAFNAITSFSMKPLRLFTFRGLA